MRKRTQKRDVKTGRRENPAIDGPRDRTVCFMLSQAEKDGVDRAAFCANRTRSGVLANVVANFVAATGKGKKAREAKQALFGYLAECQKAIRKRGALADKAMKGINNE